MTISRWIEEKAQALRFEIARVVAEGDDEEGLRLRSLLKELERWEALRWEIIRAARGSRPGPEEAGIGQAASWPSQGIWEGAAPGQFPAAP
ncbi:hypothetical protein [Thermoflexus sp.]|uniref:hypothetical protein n=1 Tax=Thermoflexus sp. TaxID=1969742 RepID=UPI0025EAAF29|nr:hypothetical protein [Thermoflexus sp.]MDW8179725.1 hypothetical protein [Anaerolineae bacterium]MCS6964648.1 hypothetical protein [Thermoflexus sp.]MCS7350274.1 hypothetical protein [Thermoflexus sp.]MCX7689601.1 hypothetical protein [Thermoflexus sp.]MDW8184201.1 hypothetical protein [Anaerolineae bacterium]